MCSWCEQRTPMWGGYRGFGQPENPGLYAIAKKVTLEAGLPYTDPRNGKTTKPPKKKAKAKK